jgi:Ca2+-binding RTX toxin-like protein
MHMHHQGNYGDWRDNHILSTAFAGTGGAQHIYGAGGNDILQLDFAQSPNRYWHGHHVRGDSDLATDRGSDVFNFTNIRNVKAGTVVVGRIEDLDYSRDKIQIEGKNLNLFKLPAHVKIVEFNGAHNDPGAVPQQWLLITTPTGGKIFYALEGARADMNGDGNSNNGNSEEHFVSREFLPNLDTLKEVDFVIKQNYVPHGATAQGGIVINDDDMKTGGYQYSQGSLVSQGWVRETIGGTSRGDLIAAGLNNDAVSGFGGQDQIWGGSGHDTLRGGGGNDSLYGGMHNDRLIGGTGSDHLEGNDGNDRLMGGAGADHLDGGAGIDTADYSTAANAVRVDFLKASANRGEAAGDIHRAIENLSGSHFDDVLGGNNGRNLIRGDDGHDRILGRMGNDILHGGGGDDTLKGDRGFDTVTGGTGEDVFIFAPGHDRMLVTDFWDDLDSIDLRPFGFGSRAEALSHAEQRGHDVVFDFGGGDVLTIRHAHVMDLANDLLI